MAPVIDVVMIIVALGIIVIVAKALFIKKSTPGRFGDIIEGEARVAANNAAKARPEAIYAQAIAKAKEAAAEAHKLVGQHKLVKIELTDNLDTAKKNLSVAIAALGKAKADNDQERGIEALKEKKAEEAEIRALSERLAAVETSIRKYEKLEKEMIERVARLKSESTIGTSEIRAAKIASELDNSLIMGDENLEAVQAAVKEARSAIDAHFDSTSQRTSLSDYVNEQTDDDLAAEFAAYGNEDK